jgi:CBS domain-containing protein
MDTAKSVLDRKGRRIWHVTPETSVYDALELMSEKEIGALLVMSGSLLLGILSERDYARKIILKGKSSRDTSVAEIMTSPPIVAGPDQRVEECMRLMTVHRVRHLPVVENGTVMGVVSIGDLVNWIISRQEEQIQQLHQYIAGSYPA